MQSHGTPDSPDPRGIVMKTINFGFLRESCPELADLAGFAESYAYSDPSSALVKLRSFAEAMVSRIFDRMGLAKPYEGGLNDWLRTSGFQDSVHPAVVSKLHALRTNGNKAAHGKQVTSQTVLWLLEEAHTLSTWFYISFCGAKKEDCPGFIKVAPEMLDSKAELKREKRAILEKMAKQEAEMAKLLDELEKTRSQAVKAEKSKEEIQSLLENSQQVANAMDLSEEATRLRYIDEMLSDAGWVVCNSEDKSKHEGASIAEREVEVPHQPTNSGMGSADYVLWDDNGKPLAVVEAKKVGHNVEKGRQQARIYADGLEKKFGQRPIIIYTNGIDIRLWNDAAGEVPRAVYGMYSKDSLQRILQRNQQRKDLRNLAPDQSIVGGSRLFQLEAIARVCEHFQNNHRKALIVQATGTGKTRVSIGLTKLLIEAGWVRRVLFLCDRRELRKQALGAFKEYLPSEPRTILTSKSKDDLDHHIFLATYPSMMKTYQTFDVGFFDLIVADESHRSIYNRYKPLFDYFDCLQVGLTATPVKFQLLRNTFRVFQCENEKPTFFYSYPEAIKDTPPTLVPFKVITHTTKFLRKGIRYSELSEEQKAEVEDQGLDSDSIDYSKEQVDKQVFNKDTDRKVIRNLMENGIKKADGQTLGKSIIFARSHAHAILLQELFDEMYSQYGGTFCAVIDNYIDRAEQLIDDFKDPQNDLTIAISVDMLDTGIDVPEVVNLVFAKPVKSYVKFWQMIGRGTRLCSNLFGPGDHKTHFQIFDHWGNFEFFDERTQEEEPANPKSLMQYLFESRIELAETALAQQDSDSFEQAIQLIQKDVAALPEKTIAVKEKWRQKRSMEDARTLQAFEATTIHTLKQDIAPLMTWMDIKGSTPAYRFDLLMTRLQKHHLAGSPQFDDAKAQLEDLVFQLPINLNQVKSKKAYIDQVRSAEFWKNVSRQELEDLRQNLRGIVHHVKKTTAPRPEPTVMDLSDVAEEAAEYKVKLEGLELVAYKAEVKRVLDQLFEQNIALQKIKAGKAVTQNELEDLASKVLLRDPKLKIDDLLNHYPNEENRIDLAIRSIIGMDADAVNRQFQAFTEKYPQLSAHQLRFLSLLKNHIAQFGLIELDLLYEEPFTSIDEEGVEGVFTKSEQIDDLLELLTNINKLAS